MKTGTLIDRVLLKNAGSMGAWQLASYIIPLITLPYLSRTLGPEQFGAMNYAISIIAIAGIITDWGFGLSASGEIARSQPAPERVRKIFWSTIAAKSLLALLTLLILLSMAAVKVLSGDILALTLAAWLSLLGNVLLVNWYFQGVEKMAGIAFATIVGRLVCLPLFFIFVTTPDDGLIATLIFSATNITCGLLSIWLALRNQELTLYRISYQDVWLHLRRGAHLFLSTAAINVYTTSNVVILGFFCSPATVGFFVGASRIQQAINGVSTPISSAVYPRITRLFQIDHGTAFKLVRYTLLIQTGGVAIVSGLVYTYADAITRLVLGSAYGESVPILQVLAWVPVAVSLSNVLGTQLLIPLGWQRELSRILLSSAALSLLLIVPLVMTLGGLGAAITALLVECYTAAAMFFYLVFYAKVRFW